MFIHTYRPINWDQEACPWRRLIIHFSAVLIYNFPSRIRPWEISPPTFECQNRHTVETHGSSFPATNRKPCPAEDTLLLSSSYNLSASFSIMFPAPWVCEVSYRFISVVWASHVYCLLHLTSFSP